MQRRFRGYENEELRLATVRGDINYDRYARSFLQDNPLEVFLGPDIWTSSPYRVLRAGSVVTALYPDPAGGAYRFERDIPGVSLLQRKAALKRLSRSGTGQRGGGALGPVLGSSSLSSSDVTLDRLFPEAFSTW